MADNDKRLLELDALTEPSPDDYLHIVDASDETMGPGGTDKRIALSDLLRVDPPKVVSPTSGAIALAGGGAHELGLTGDATVTLPPGAPGSWVSLIANRDGHALAFAGAGIDEIEWPGGSPPDATGADPTAYDFAWLSIDAKWLGSASSAGGGAGPKGDPGDPGAAATVAVGSVATGAAGSSAVVVNSGTSSAAVLDFTIPRGDKGEQGIQGVPGEQGEPGAAASNPVYCLARWTSPADAALAAGDLVPHRPTCLNAVQVVAVTVNALTNGAGGGLLFQLTADGSPIFTAEQAYAAGTTDPAAYSAGVILSTLPALSKLAASIVAVGDDVMGVTIELWAREV